MKLIMENWRKYNNEPFQLMLEQYDKKILSEKQLFETWQKDTLKELKQLNEIDWEKEAELTVDPDYKPPHERDGILQKGWEKVNDWILEKSIQLVDLAKRSAMAALKSISWLINKVGSFCGGHPTVCKVAIMSLVVFAFYMAMAMFHTPEAQAQLAIGKEPLSQETVDVMKGYLNEMLEIKKERDPLGTDFEFYHKLLAQIDELQSKKDLIDITNVTEKVNHNLNVVYEGLKEFMQKQDKDDARHWYGKWQDIGSRIRAWWSEITYNNPDTGKVIRKLTKHGMKILNKGN